MKSMKIGVVGLGSLGSALLKGLSRSAAPYDIMVCVRPEKVRETTEQIQSAVTGDIKEAVAFADVVFIAVKARVFEELAAELDADALQGKKFVSLMAGVKLERLRELLPGAEIVRAMPSLAIATQNGVIGYTACAPQIAELLEKLGYAFEVAPEDIEKVTAFAACGLGFAAYLIDALAQAGQNLGFTRGQADAIAARTFENACQRGGDFASLVNSVATKGGATEQGILHFDEMKVYDVVYDAVKKAYEKVK